MMLFSFAFLGLLFSAAAAKKNTNAASRGRGLRHDTADTLEASMTKLFKALQEQNRPIGAKDNYFSNRLADVEMKHTLLAKLKGADSIKESIGHLTAAQQEDQHDMGAVLSHLKSAVSNLNTFIVENNSRRGLLEDPSAPEAVSAVDFRESMQCAAKAALADDLEAFLSCTQMIKEGIQAAIQKVNSALDAMTTEGLKELEELLAKRLSEAQNDPAIAAALQDPGATIGQLVSGQQGGLGPIYDFLMLLWLVPVSILWGGVLWMFIGLWTYGPEYGIIGSLWFEISWILSGLACLFTVDVACGIWDPDSDSTIWD